uniref:Restriction endonuclease, type II, EcoRV n=1 Tax=uncultured organism TaxID=155900 RepID=M1PPS6_9ZZZZ|nr:restriction endonuclease, type II, EcoRV [uncultured organism]
MDFIKESLDRIEEWNIDWKVYGMVDRRDRVYSLGDDTKILGRIFELLVAPLVEDIAQDHGLTVQPASSQTIYPDFTLMESPEDQHKIAVDVKTTYRRGKYQQPSTKYGYEAGEEKPFKFTLGSYASFLRDNTKNIEFNYKTYDKDYIIGFIYSRNEQADEGIVKDIDDKEEIEPPYLDVEYFVQEKYKIAGEKPGSGNTENLGNFVTNDVEELQNGEGPFAEHGKEVFKDYWRNYGRYREEGDYNNLDEYFDWVEKQED